MTTVEDPETGDRVQECECVHCHYCETYLSRWHEHDHFPVPKSAGGTETVPACENCHEIKDRTPMFFWPGDLAARGIAEVLASVGDFVDPELKDPLKIVAAVGDYQVHWATWSLGGRLFYAKAAFLSAVRKHRDMVKTAGLS